MKLVREHINEVFTDTDSDPIQDLGIGFTINFEKKAQETIRTGTNDGWNKWMYYLNNIVGKKVCGIFFKEKEIKTTGEIINYQSCNLGSELTFIDEHKNSYQVLPNQKYIIIG